jgi:hypothetical protein
MEPGDPQVVIYYFLACLSIIGNVLVLWSLWKIRKSVTCFTCLLGYLHGTTIIEEILVLPFLYKPDYTLCLVVESLQCYFGFMNIMTVAMLVEAHLTNIFEDKYEVRTKIVTYSKYVLFGVPLIVFFGFFNGAFTQSHTAFCVVPSQLDNIVFLFFYYLEIWILLFYSVSRMIYSWTRIYYYDSLLASKYFSSIGFYIIVAIVSWVPRSVIRFSDQAAEDDDAGSSDDNSVANDLFLAAFYPLQIAGILFAVIYFREKAAIKSFAAFNHTVDEVNLTGEGFSWDEILNSSASSNPSMSSKMSMSTDRHSNVRRSFMTPQPQVQPVVKTSIMKTSRNLSGGEKNNNSNNSGNVEKGVNNNNSNSVGTDENNNSNNGLASEGADQRTTPEATTTLTKKTDTENLKMLITDDQMAIPRESLSTVRRSSAINPLHANNAESKSLANENL